MLIFKFSKLLDPKINAFDNECIKAKAKVIIAFLQDF